MDGWNKDIILIYIKKIKIFNKNKLIWLFKRKHKRKYQQIYKNKLKIIKNIKIKKIIKNIKIIIKIKKNKKLYKKKYHK